VEYIVLEKILYFIHDVMTYDIYPPIAQMAS